MAFKITLNHLIAIAKPIGNKPSLLMPALVESINNICPLYEIDTANEFAHFLAQACHESGGFSTTRENLNYGAQGLLDTFPKYFNAASAAAYAKQPQKIASKVYANRMGNGDEKSADGWKFKGRGIFQNTGRDQYLKLGIAKGNQDLFIANPELLEEPDYAVWSACEFWKGKDLTNIANHKDTDLLKYKIYIKKGKLLVSKLIDVSPLEYISRSINGGTNGLEDRKICYSRAKLALV
jgi:putative chitinase